MCAELKKSLCGVMVLLTPIQLLQRAASLLQGAVHGGPHEQGGLINAVLLKKKWRWESGDVCS